MHSPRSECALVAAGEEVGDAHDVPRSIRDHSRGNRAVRRNGREEGDLAAAKQGREEDPRLPGALAPSPLPVRELRVGLDPEPAATGSAPRGIGAGGAEDPLGAEEQPEARLLQREDAKAVLHRPRRGGPRPLELPHRRQRGLRRRREGHEVRVVGRHRSATQPVGVGELPGAPVRAAHGGAPGGVVPREVRDTKPVHATAFSSPARAPAPACPSAARAPRGGSKPRCPRASAWRRGR